MYLQIPVIVRSREKSPSESTAALMLLNLSKERSINLLACELVTIVVNQIFQNLSGFGRLNSLNVRSIVSNLYVTHNPMHNKYENSGGSRGR